MPIDTNEMKTLAQMVPNLPDIQAILTDAADYIETLRKQLHEAHSHNRDSIRLDWLERQAHKEYSAGNHRRYHVLPRIRCRGEGLRNGIDAYLHLPVEGE